MNKLLHEGAAEALINSVYQYLIFNNIDPKWIESHLATLNRRSASKVHSNKFRAAFRAYEDMGAIIATWFADPAFLDKDGSPAPLSAGKGRTSIKKLLLAAGSELSTLAVKRLLQESPSIRKIGEDSFIPISRVFMLPSFELLRAATVVERFLETLKSNSEASMKGSPLMFERSSYAHDIDLKSVMKLLRDIKSRGTGFMNGVDGEIEAQRNKRRSGEKKDVELGVFTFVWARPTRKPIKRNKPSKKA